MARLTFRDTEMCTRYNIEKTIDILTNHLKQAEMCAKSATAANLDDDGEQEFIAKWYSTLSAPRPIITEEQFCQLVWDIMDEEEEYALLTQNTSKK